MTININNILESYVLDTSIDVKDKVLSYLGFHVAELAPKNVPLLEKIREKHFKKDDEEIDFYIKSAKKSQKIPYWKHLKETNLVSFKSYVNTHPTWIDWSNLKEDDSLLEIFITLFTKTPEEKKPDLIKACIKDLPFDKLLPKIESEEDLYSLIKHCVKEDGWSTLSGIKYLKITNPAFLFEIAKLCAQINPGATAVKIRLFNITDQNHLFEIAKLCAQHNGDATAYQIQSFNIKDQDLVFEIAKLCAQQKGNATAKKIKYFKISDQDQLFELAKLCAQQNGEATAQCIKNFKIISQGRLLEIAKLCAQQNGEGTSSYIANFDLLSQEGLFEIAKLCAQQSGDGTSRNINNFGLKIQDHRFEVAKICAQQDGWRTAAFFKLFHIDDLNRHFQIAKLCIQQSNRATPFISNFDLTQPQREAIFVVGLKKSFELLFSIDRFKIAPEKVKRFEEWKVLESQDPWPEAEAISILRDFDARCLPFIEALEKVTNSWARKQIILWLASTMFLVKEELNDTQAAWLDKQKLLPAIAALQIPFLRFFITMDVLKLTQSSEGRKVYDNLTDNRYEKYPWGGLLKASVALIIPKLGEKIWAVCNQSFNTFKDMKKMGVLIRALEIVRLLADPERTLEKMFSFKGKALLKQCYALTALYDLDKLSLLKTQEDLLICAEKALKETLSLGEIKDIAQKYMQTFGASRHPQALLIYTAKMKSLKDESVMRCLSNFVTSVLNGTFLQERYTLKNNPHLQRIPEEMLEKWKMGSSKSLITSKEKETKIPANLEWLKLKLLTDRHIDMTRFPELETYLKDPTKDIREKLLEQDSIESRIQLHCIDLVETSSDEEKLKILNALHDELSKFTPSEFLNDINGLINRKNSVQEVALVDTDDPFDLMLCGTEVAGSCQRLDGDPELNKGLLGYLMDGKNRLLAIKDPEGKSIARCMLRLLWDGEKPVLFRERLYPSGINDEYAKALNELARDKAEHLGVPIMALDGSGEEYTLHALGGPVPFEYSDGARGICPNGVYTISNAKLLSF